MVNILKKIIAYIVILINAIVGISNNSNNIFNYKYIKYNNVAINDNDASAINCLNGYYVPGINMPDQQRYFKANIIRNINRDIERVTIGSSHMLTIRYEDDNIDHINLSVGGANLQDRLNILGLLHFHNVKYKFVNFEIDIPSFTETAFIINKGYDFLSDYGDYFLKVLNGEDVSDFTYIDYNKNYKNLYENIGYNLYYKTKDKLNFYKLFYYDKEASQHIPEELNNGNDSWKENTVSSLAVSDQILKNMHINQKSVDVYNKIFKYFEDNDVEVNIILIPRSPRIYDSENMNSFPIVNEIMEYAFNISKNKGVKITGSLNPHYINSKDEYYFDGLHFKQEVANSIIDIRR